MTNASIKDSSLQNLTDEEICLDNAYAQSAGQDKLISSDFDAFLNDGLSEKNPLKIILDSAKIDSVNKLL